MDRMAPSRQWHALTDCRAQACLAEHMQLAGCYRRQNTALPGRDMQPQLPEYMLEAWQLQAQLSLT